MCETTKSPNGRCQRHPLPVDPESDAIVVGGELDATTVPMLRAVLAPLIRIGGRLRIDLRDVTFIGANGVHLLADTAAALGATGRVVVVDPSSVVRRVIGLFGAELGIDIERTGRHRGT